MSLEGDLSELPFVEIVQLYGTGRKPVAVHLQVPGIQGDDGDAVFCLEEGKLTEAKFGRLSGREAFRCALALTQGPFRVEMDVRSPGGGTPELLTHVLIEELARLDQERAAAGMGPLLTPIPRTGSTPLFTPIPRTGSTPLLTPIPRTGSMPLLTPFPQPGEATPSVAPADVAEPAEPAAAKPASRARLLTVTVVAAAVAVAVLVLAVALKRSHGSGAAIDTGRQAGGPPGSTRGVTSDEVAFGMASPLNGPNRDLGRAMKAGIELAFVAANDAGGVHGRKLRLVALDDGNDPEASAKAVRDLVERQQVFAVVGNAGTSTASVALPYLVASKVVYLGAISGAAALRKDPPDRYVFNYRPSLAEETSAAVRYLVEVRRIPVDRIAVFAEEGDFGEAGFAGVARELRQRGRGPAQIVRLGYARNSADVDAAVAKIRRFPQLRAVVMIATCAPAARFIQRLRGAASNLVFTNVSAVDSTALAEQLREARVSAAGDVVVTQVVPNPLSRATAVSRYRKLLEEKAVGEQVGTLSLEGYVVGTLAVEALRRAGPGLDSERFVQALEGIRELDVGIGTKLTFGPQEHQASHKLWGTALDGSWSYQPVELE